MKVQTRDDLVVSMGQLPTGHTIPDDLAALPMDRLRFDGQTVIDGAARDRFAIDNAGVKHLPEMADPDWPQIDCAIDDVLIDDGGGWRIETEADRLTALKAEARQKVIACCNSFAAPILARYPAAEQAGWDKREAEARAIVTAADGGGDVAAAIAATLIVAALATAAGWTEARTVDHARSIIAKAAEFAAISAEAERLRETGMAAIETAGDAAGVKAALDALDADAAACAATHGLV